MEKKAFLTRRMCIITCGVFPGEKATLERKKDSCSDPQNKNIEFVLRKMLGEFKCSGKVAQQMLCCNQQLMTSVISKGFPESDLGV